MKKVTSLLIALLASWSLASPGKALTPAEVQTLIQIRSGLFSGFQYQAAFGMLAGQGSPIFGFDTLAGQTFINFKVEEDDVPALKAFMNLPPGLSLAPIRIFQNERPHYYLVLTLYDATDWAEGAKAEWNTFVVADGDPNPRYYLLEAQSEEPTFDPSVIFAPAALVCDWNYADGVASAEVRKEVGDQVQSIDYYAEVPQAPVIEVLSEQVVAANNVVHYAPSGHAVPIYYNSQLANTNVISLDPGSVQFHSDYPWMDFVEEITSIYMTTEDSAFLFEPWNQALVPATDQEVGLMLQIFESIGQGVPLIEAFEVLRHSVRPEVLPTLTFAGMSILEASQVEQGARDPLMGFSINGSPRSLFINYRIAKNQENLIDLPEGFELAKVRTIESQKKPEFMISLNVYEMPSLNGPGNPDNIRAEWSTFVTKEGDPTPRFMILHAETLEPGLDPVYALENFAGFAPENIWKMFTPPAWHIDYSVDPNTGMASFVGVSESVEVQIALPTSGSPGKVRRDWMAANDIIYWSNGVGDEAYATSDFYYSDVTEIDPNAIVVISDNTPFAGIVEPQPMQAFYFEGGLDIKLRPWGNLTELLAEAYGSN